MKEKIEEKKLNLSHVCLETQIKNPDPWGAGLEPGPHPKKSGFNWGPVLSFTHPVQSWATPKPRPDSDFAKPIQITGKFLVKASLEITCFVNILLIK